MTHETTVSLCLSDCSSFRAPPSRLHLPGRVCTPGYTRRILVNEAERVFAPEMPGDVAEAEDVIADTMKETCASIGCRARGTDSSLVCFLVL